MVASVIVAIGVRIVVSAAKEAVHAAVLLPLSILLGALIFGTLATVYVLGGLTPYLLEMGHREPYLFAQASEDFVGGWIGWLLILMILAWITGGVIGGAVGLLVWCFRDARWLVHLGERWPRPELWRVRVVLPVVAGVLVIAAPVIWFTGPSPRPTEFTAGRVEDFTAGSATLFEDDGFYRLWLVRLQSGDFVAVDGVAQPSLCRVLRRPDSEFTGHPAWFVDDCDGLVYAPTGQFAGDPHGRCHEKDISGKSYPCDYAYLFRFPVHVSEGKLVVDLSPYSTPYIPSAPPGAPPVISPTQTQGSTGFTPLTPGTEVGFGISDPSHPGVFPVLRIVAVDFDLQRLDFALIGPYSGPLPRDLKIGDDLGGVCQVLRVTFPAGDTGLSLSAGEKLVFTVEYACEKGRAVKFVGLFGIIFEHP